MRLDDTQRDLHASVLIATRNRGHLLRGTLAQLAAQRAEGLRFEVVVVDNGSDDDTAAVLAAARATLPLVALSEPRPGKNRAVNRALCVARAALLVFTDDDVEPAPGWLAEHVAAARRWPAHAVFGGPVVPRLPPETPAWLATHPFAVAAFARWEPEIGREGPCATLPFGPNFSVRAARMRGIEFREDLGSQGGAGDLMGGETELLQRLAAAGERVVFVPTAPVAHLIQPHQTTPRWLFERAFRHGRTYRRLHGGERRALAASRLCAKLAVRSLAHAVAPLAGERARVESGIKLFQARGQLYQHALGRPAIRRAAALLLP